MTNLAYGQRTAFSAFAQKTVLSSRFKRASGIVPYNVSAAQNTEGIKHSLPAYGFRLPATFAQIPTWDGEICRMSAKLDVVQSGADRQRFVQSHGGLGQRVANKNTMNREKMKKRGKTYGHIQV